MTGDAHDVALHVITCAHMYTSLLSMHVLLRVTTCAHMYTNKDILYP